MLDTVRVTKVDEEGNGYQKQGKSKECERSITQGGRRGNHKKKGRQEVTFLRIANKMHPCCLVHDVLHNEDDKKKKLDQCW